MNHQVSRHELANQDELNEVKAQLGAAERDRNRVFEELKETKLRLSKLSGDNNEELDSLRESLRHATMELKSKDKIIVSLKAEIENHLTEKDDALKTMEDQLSFSKELISQQEALLSNSKKDEEELKAELERRRESEAKLFNSFVNQTNQLQEASFMIEKHRLDAASLCEKMEALEEDKRLTNNELERLRTEAMALNKGDKSATIETKTLLNEIDFLKNELMRAMEAEENKDKAMDDLALVLTEVASECNRAKEKLLSTEQQLKAVKEESTNLKKMVKGTEGRYEALLKEHKKQNDRLTNIINRLRLEADESVLAWSGKEVEFVKCIKKAEDDKNKAQAEYYKLMKSAKEAQGVNEKTKEETKKLKDILEQALNEANVAKEDATLVRTENSYLKNSLADKDKALVSLAQETELLRLNEAEANESIKELKRIITSGSKKEFAKLELKRADKKEAGSDNIDKDSSKERKLSSTFSFDLNQLWPSTPCIAAKSSKDSDEDMDMDDALGGSIFDLVKSPEKDPPPYHRRTSSACSSSDDRINLAFENFDDDAHFDDMEIERSSHGKKKALLRRFSDLLRRKNSHPPKDLPHPPKEVAHPLKEIAA